MSFRAQLRRALCLALLACAVTSPSGASGVATFPTAANFDGLHLLEARVTAVAGAPPVRPLTYWFDLRVARSCGPVRRGFEYRLMETVPNPDFPAGYAGPSAELWFDERPVRLELPTMEPADPSAGMTDLVWQWNLDLPDTSSHRIRLAVHCTAVAEVDLSSNALDAAFGGAVEWPGFSPPLEFVLRFEPPVGREGLSNAPSGAVYDHGRLRVALSPSTGSEPRNCSLEGLHLLWNDNSAILLDRHVISDDDYWAEHSPYGPPVSCCGEADEWYDLQAELQAAAGSPATDALTSRTRNWVAEQHRVVTQVVAALSALRDSLERERRHGSGMPRNADHGLNPIARRNLVLCTALTSAYDVRRRPSEVVRAEAEAYRRYGPIVTPPASP